MGNGEIMKVSKELREAIENLQKDIRKETGENITLIEASKKLARDRDIELEKSTLEERDLLNMFD